MIELYRQAERAYSLYQNEHNLRLDYYEFRNLLYYLKAHFTHQLVDNLYISDEFDVGQHGYIFYTEEWKLKNAILAYLNDNIEYLNLNKGRNGAF